MATQDFHSFDEIRAILERVLETSLADETELVWYENRRGAASHPADPRNDFLEPPRLTVLLRVVEGRRQGWHRTEIADVHLLESGLRQALALAKVQPEVRRQPVFPTDSRNVRFSPPIFDPEISELTAESAGRLLAEHCGDGGRGRLTWNVTRLAVINSHGVRRRADATEATFTAVAGDGPGAGRAAGSARRLEELRLDEVCRRALDRHGRGETADLPAGALPVLLSPEAVAELLNVINTFAFSSRAYLDGSSLLARHRNDQVFDRGFNLRDDATRVPGVPFPFDLEGSPKRSLDVIVKGQPATPALNLVQGAQAGLTPTAQAVGGQDSLFGNLFLLPGEAAGEDLLAAADGGLQVSWLDPPECWEPTQLHIRARARGVRRIEDGKLGRPLPDLIWEESLVLALARLRAIGSELVVRTMPSTLLGAVTAPAVVIESDGFRQP